MIMISVTHRFYVANAYQHLSNNSIQKEKIKDYENSEIDGLMWKSSKFRDFLLEKYVLILI